MAANNNTTSNVNMNLVNDVLAIVEVYGFDSFQEYAKSQGDQEWTCGGLWEASGYHIAYGYEWEELEAVVDHLWVD